MVLYFATEIPELYTSIRVVSIPMEYIDTFDFLLCGANILVYNGDRIVRQMFILMVGNNDNSSSCRLHGCYLFITKHTVDILDYKTIGISVTKFIHHCNMKMQIADNPGYENVKDLKDHPTFLTLHDNLTKILNDRYNPKDFWILNKQLPKETKNLQLTIVDRFNPAEKCTKGIPIPVPGIDDIEQILFMD